MAVNASHFAQAWKWALEPDSLCMRSDLFYIIKNGKLAKLGKVSMDEVGIEVIDERTLRVTLEHPAPYFLDLLTHPVYSPLYCKESIPTIFNGPYLLEQWKHDVVIQLALNSSYWDLEHVAIPTIQFSFVKDPMTVLSMFEQEEIDFIGDPLTTLPLDALSSETYRDRLKYQDVARTYWIYVNTEKFPYNSTKLRRAFGLALDRQQLTDHVFLGCLPHHSPVPRNLSLLSEEELVVKTDPFEARQLFEEGLKELGLTRETLPPVILSHSTITGQKTLAEAIQQRWSDVLGIDVQIEGAEWSVLASYFNTGKFQMGGCLRSAVYNDPLYHLEIFKDKEFPYNASFWENDAYKQLIERAAQTCDPQERLAHLKAAENVLMDEMPVIPIYVDTYKYMTNRGLTGFIIDKSGCIDFKESTF
jgi:oligopeptide transport system substrate-binding protein